MEMEDLSGRVDREAEFLALKKETGNEWEMYKENVRPLKRGRNVKLLNEALKSHSGNGHTKSLLENRRRLVEAIDEYKGEDPLQPWLECIKWVQESFPSGGESSGLIVIYEQCVRTFWHTERYKDDLRYLKVWLEYAEHCADAEVIYGFLDSNQIGQTHSLYYRSYALHLESKNKLRKADDIFNLGIVRKARPVHKLESAYKKFLVRSMRRQKAVEEEPINDHQPVRSFGTVLAASGARRQTTEKSDIANKKAKLQRAPLSVYKDTDLGSTKKHQSDQKSFESEVKSWHTLGTQVERNKENAAIPTKWTSYKIPPRGQVRTGAATPSTCIEVFVDDECEEVRSTDNVTECTKPSLLQLRQGDSRDFTKETELLKENPLRNFPLNSLPR